MRELCKPKRFNVSKKSYNLHLVNNIESNVENCTKIIYTKYKFYKNKKANINRR